MKKTGIFKQNSVIFFTIGMIITKASSFLVNIVLSFKYGASYISDSVIISLNIPVVLFAGLITTISTCYVPIHKEIEQNDKNGINRVTSNMINILFVLFAGVCIILFLFPNAFIRLFANGMSVEALELASKITKWVAVACLFSSTTGLLQGYLQSNNRFKLVSLSSLPINLVLALAIFISSVNTICIILGIGLVLAYFLQFLLFSIESSKVGYKWYPKADYRCDYFRRLILMIFPIFIGTLIYDINSIVDKRFASMLPEGSISVLDYAYKVSGAAIGIIAYPLTTILYTKLSDYGAKKQYDSLSETVNLGLQRLSFFMIPILSCLIALSSEFVRILFFRGNFTTEDVEQTSVCLILYLIGMYAVSYRALFDKVFYSLKKTRITLKNTIITVLVNILFDFILYKPFGSYGLAFATSISQIISMLFLYVLLKKQIGYSISKEVKRDLVKYIVSSFVSVLFVLITKRMISTNVFRGLFAETVQCCMLALEGLIIYVLLLFVFKETKIHNFLRRYKERYK